MAEWIRDPKVIQRTLIDAAAECPCCGCIITPVFHGDMLPNEDRDRLAKSFAGFSTIEASIEQSIVDGLSAERLKAMGVLP